MNGNFKPDTEGTHPVSIAMADVREAFILALTERFPDQIALEDDVLYVTDNNVPQADLDALVKGVAAAIQVATVRPVSYDEKQEIQGKVRDRAIAAVRQVDVQDIDYWYNSDAENALVKAYAAEVVDDIARSLGAE